MKLAVGALTALTWLLFVAGSIFLWYLHNAGFFLIIGSKIELATIVLTAAALVLAGVAAVIAILALFSFEVIRKAAVEAATKEAISEAGRVARLVAPVAAIEAAGAVQGTTPEDAQKIAAATDGKHD